eukprot:7017849-Prymnesium_polylepis.1
MRCARRRGRSRTCRRGTTPGSFSRCTAPWCDHTDHTAHTATLSHTPCVAPHSDAESHTLRATTQPAHVWCHTQPAQRGT